MNSTTAIIIEPRKHPALFISVNSVRKHLPDTPVIIIHGDINKDFVQVYRTDPMVSLLNISLSNFSLTAYNWFFFSWRFISLLESLSTSHILIFETDSMLCNSPHTIDEFYKYDYIGAPWKMGIRSGFNGGLSLSNRQFMISCLKRNLPTVEDTHFVDTTWSICSLYGDHTTSPSPEIASHFSVESEFYDKPFGIHKAWKYLPADKWKILCERTPELLDLYQENINISPYQLYIYTFKRTCIFIIIILVLYVLFLRYVG